MIDTLCHFFSCCIGDVLGYVGFEESGKIFDAVFVDPLTYTNSGQLLRLFDGSLWFACF